LRGAAACRLTSSERLPKLTELPEFTAIVNGKRERVRRTPEPDDYLLYPEWRKGGKVHKARPKERLPRQTLHRWSVRAPAAGRARRG
jgi:hypothetical protein